MASHTIMKESSMVFPASDTPNHAISLSGLDTAFALPYSHTTLLYIYAPNSSNSNSNSNSNIDTALLKSCLSKVLVPFYPMAGRLRNNPKTNNLEITCNAKGVLFIETATNKTLDDFGEFTPSHALREVALPEGYDSSVELSSFPVFMVQLTRFKCGGVMLGVMVHKYVVDGFSTAYFVNSWSRLCRGFDIEVLPCHDRVRYMSPREPPSVKFSHFEYESPLSRVVPSGNTITCNLFKFSKAQISALKQHPMFQLLNPKPTTYAIITAHLWRCVCKARDLPYDQEVRLYIPLTGRSRLRNPNLPQGYFGYAAFRGRCLAKAGDVASKPLWHTTKIVQEAILRMDNEYLRSAIDYLALHPEFTSSNPSFTLHQQESYPNCSVNSWTSIPFDKADFGSGGPACVRRAGVGPDGQTLIMPNTNGYTVSVNLSTVHMDSLKKYIYDFVEIHASL